jgi:hypothetical protein
MDKIKLNKLSLNDLSWQGVKPCIIPSKLGLTNGEWATVGEEAGQWQMGGQSTVEEREAVCTS